MKEDSRASKSNNLNYYYVENNTFDGIIGHPLKSQFSSTASRRFSPGCVIASECTVAQTLPHDDFSKMSFLAANIIINNRIT